MSRKANGKPGAVPPVDCHRTMQLLDKQRHQLQPQRLSLCQIRVRRQPNAIIGDAQANLAVAAFTQLNDNRATSISGKGMLE